MTDAVQDVTELDAIYGAPPDGALKKVTPQLTPLYRKWIGASRLMMLSTVGPEGTDCSPRGDVDPVVRIEDDKTLLMPDWRGNNRIDSLRNIVRDSRVSLMFLVPGDNNVVRANGVGEVTIAPEVLESFVQMGRHPRSVVRFTITELYFQCAKAFMRSRAWTCGDESEGLPKAGDFLKEQMEGFDAKDYDDNYVERSQAKMW